MFETQHHPPAKRAREESDPESDGDDMDFQHAANITATQALDDTNHESGYLQAELPPPLTPEHAALRADFQMINGRNMEKLFQRISADFNATLEKTTNQLQSQILSLTTRISMP